MLSVLRKDLRMSPGLHGSAGGRPPVHREAAGSVPGQGTSPGCGLDPWFGACRRQPTSISLSPKINEKIFKENNLKNARLISSN